MLLSEVRCSAESERLSVLQLGRKKQSDYVNSMKIKLTVNDISNPTEYIDMNPIRMRMKRSSGQYWKVLEVTQEILSCLELIIRDNQAGVNAAPVKNNSDPADEILKYKKCLTPAQLRWRNMRLRKSSCSVCKRLCAFMIGVLKRINVENR